MSKQALSDVSGLDAYINSRLLWALAKVVDDQVVAGDDQGQNLRGIVPFAVSFDRGLLSPQDGYDRATVLGAAVAQVRTSGFNPDFILLHPTDAFRMRFQRDQIGQYVNIPKLPQIVETVSISQGTFLVGDASRALIRVRQAAVVQASESDADNWTRNLVTLRAEERMLLQVLSIRAFVTGALNTSPA
jgi:hypothetical protein